MDIEGYPVLEVIPDFSDNPNSSARRIHNLVALSQARRIVAFRGKRVTEAFQHKYVFASRAAIAEFEAFFEGRCGRWQPFWLPSWRADLALAADIAASASTADVVPVGYKTEYDPTLADTKALGHYLYMVKPDLTVFATRVNSVSVGTVERLALASAAPDDFPMISTVVCFLHFVRFMNDDLQMRYSGPASASCEMGFVEVTTSEVEADS